jgi:hypothetical protein
MGVIRDVGPQHRLSKKKPCEICGKIVNVKDVRSRAFCKDNWSCEYEFMLKLSAEERARNARRSAQRKERAYGIQGMEV